MSSGSAGPSESKIPSGESAEIEFENHALPDSSNPFTLIIPKYRLPFLTSDGILYNISLGFSDSNDKIIFVDINGSKKPNILGKDTFAFIGKPLENRNIIVGYCHENDKTQIDNECSENGQGFCCAEKIMRENWQINYKF